MKNTFFALLLAFAALAFAAPPEVTPPMDDASCHIEMTAAIDAPALTASVDVVTLDAELENGQDHFAELPEEIKIVTIGSGYEVRLCHYESKSHCRYSWLFEPYNSSSADRPPLQRC